MTTFLTPHDMGARATPPRDGVHGWAPTGPRVLYIDADDDLPQLLDRVEEAQGAAIVVLPEGARAMRGFLSARLLKRRAVAAGIELVAVTTDRTARAALESEGIPTAQTVGDARPLLLDGAGSVTPPAQTPLPRTASAPPARATGPVAPVSDEDDDWFATDEDAADQADEAAGKQDEGDAQPAASISAAAAAQAPTIRMPRVMPREAPAPDVDAYQPPMRIGSARSPVAVIGRVMRLIACLAVLALVAVGAWTYFFPTATIAIHYGSGLYDRTYSTVAGGEVPIHTTHISQDATETVAASGNRQVPDGTAGGTVTLANPLSGAVVVPAGTIVSTALGVHFATQEEVVVPAASHRFTGTTYGQASVHVGCTQAGPIGNVAAGMIVQFEGRLRGALLVTNYSGFGGGTMRTVYSITPQDVAGAATRLRAQLTAQIRGELNSKFARSPGRRITRITTNAPQVASVTHNGRLYARVTLGERIDMSYLHAGDVQQFANAHLAADLRAHERRVVPGTLTQQIRVTYAGGAMRITVHTRAHTLPIIDRSNLQGLLVGRSLSDARALLDGSAHYGSWTYTIRLAPDWGRHLPQSASLIHITLQAG